MSDDEGENTTEQPPIGNIDLKVLSVRKDEKNKKYKPLHPNLPDFNTPQVILMVGSRNVGKSNLMVNLCMRLDWGICECLDEVFLVSPNVLQDNKLKPLRERYEGNVYVDPKAINSIIGDVLKYQQSFTEDERPHSLIYYDDAVQKNSHVYNEFDLLSTRSRHNNISMATCVQKLKSAKAIYRNNATCVFLFKTRSNKEREDLYDYYGALKYKKPQFLKTFDYATKDPYSFLMVKLEGADAPRYFKNFEEDITDKFAFKKSDTKSDDEDDF